MKTVGATELKTRLGHYLLEAQVEPILIKRSKSEVGVLVSKREWERLRAMEDQIWGMMAEQAKAEGYLSEEESHDYLRRRMDDEADTVRKGKEIPRQAAKKAVRPSRKKAVRSRDRAAAAR